MQFMSGSEACSSVAQGCTLRDGCVAINARFTPIIAWRSLKVNSTSAVTSLLFLQAPNHESTWTKVRIRKSEFEPVQTGET
jgi:hypothetical protein